jgi:hypothetical protein
VYATSERRIVVPVIGYTQVTRARWLFGKAEEEVRRPYLTGAHVLPSTIVPISITASCL